MKYFILLLSIFVCSGSFAQKIKKLDLIEYWSGSYCEDNKLMIFATSQAQLDSSFNLCVEATSVHIKLKSGVNYSFEGLKKLNDISILTIEFPPFNERMDAYDDGLTSIDVIDCSFLASLKKLEFLVIDWRGFVRNIEKINSLEKLVYARLPISAFHPTLFADNSSVNQYEFGDRQGLVLLKNKKLNQLDIPHAKYEEYLSKSNLNVKLFNLKAQKTNRKGKIIWPNNFLNFNDQGDTTFYVSNKQNDSISWVIWSEKDHAFLTGHYNQKSNSWFNRLQQFGYDRQINSWGDDHYSMNFKQISSGIISSEKNAAYKNGLKHGTFSHLTNGQLDSKEIYEQGQLVYTYHQVNNLSFLNLGHPLDYEIKPTYFRMIEIFMEDDDTLLIRAYNGRIENVTTHKIVEVPYFNNKPNGNVLVFHHNGDTSIIAAYKNGLLNGEFYSNSPNETGPRITRGQYLNGKQNGDWTISSYKRSQKIKYDDGMVIYRLIINNDLKQSETIWYADKNYSETTFWSVKGKIIRVLRFNAEGKKIYSKEYPENIIPYITRDLP